MIKTLIDGTGNKAWAAALAPIAARLLTDDSESMDAIGIRFDALTQNDFILASVVFLAVWIVKNRKSE
tara:strand:- start:2024 stop:2227 length:204 start_codon:yes stop_codon:yes gene_type:complete